MIKHGAEKLGMKVLSSFSIRTTVSAGHLKHIQPQAAFSWARSHAWEAVRGGKGMGFRLWIS
jgi:hypothetical protein